MVQSFLISHVTSFSEGTTPDQAVAQDCPLKELPGNIKRKIENIVKTTICQVIWTEVYASSNILQVSAQYISIYTIYYPDKE